jgi:hypothetical protein
LPSGLPQKIYEYFSFKKGSHPNFSEMKGHFTPHGIFISNKGEKPIVKPFDEFAEFINSNIDSGNIVEIEESEIGNDVQLFGKVGQIASRYRLVTRTPSGCQTRYGVNLFQLVQYGSEWKVSSMCWDDYPDQRLFAVTAAQTGRDT